MAEEDVLLHTMNTCAAFIFSVHAYVAADRYICIRQDIIWITAIHIFIKFQYGELQSYSMLR